MHGPPIPELSDWSFWSLDVGIWIFGARERYRITQRLHGMTSVIQAM
jgi:hypothetical protein